MLPVRTNEKRGGYAWSKLRCSSDLADAERAMAGPLIPPAKRGGNKRRADMHKVVNGLIYILSTGCQWAKLFKVLVAKPVE